MTRVEESECGHAQPFCRSGSSSTPRSGAHPGRAPGFPVPSVPGDRPAPKKIGTHDLDGPG
ncbi:hypothetical protein SGM_2944 [Streptomyces griseoaurantiacus M045]|uniref:Uncharacterized protein n=1 Tax=Streptomyces griseoaurantiacus M045 TaxID=996637 RepID=F3NII0_9ACTN|nr:hypothetical protein SGM_2944 [Streptomyces griseoaurantiacus M045]